MNHLPGKLDLETGMFHCKHDNMEVIIDFKEGICYERVYPRPFTNVPVNNNALDSIIGVLNSDHPEQLWKLETADDIERFFYRSYSFTALPSPQYMKGVIGWFEWLFHKHDVYNINELPF